MEAGQPSRTAFAAAAHRAAHQVLERGSIFRDPLAIRILGAQGEEVVRRVSSDPSARPLRLFIAVRARFAEDALAAAVHRGVRQVVVLGAGLDTYAYRGTDHAGVHVFEVDHPATQGWKRNCLADAGIPAPPALTFVPVDFAQEALGTALEQSGFDPDQRSSFIWLGVVPYLAESAVLATLRYIATGPGGAEVVFDYSNPLSKAARDERAAAHVALAGRVARVSEPFKSEFETQALLATLAAMGFSDVEDLGPDQIRMRFLSGHGRSSGNEGGHVVRAATAWSSNRRC